MADVKPKTVTVKALTLHTYHDHEYKPGATYEADEGDVTTIEVQGKGVRADAASEKPATAHPLTGKIKH